MQTQLSAGGMGQEPTETRGSLRAARVPASLPSGGFFLLLTLAESRILVQKLGRTHAHTHARACGTATGRDSGL